MHRVRRQLTISLRQLRQARSEKDRAHADADAPLLVIQGDDVNRRAHAGADGTPDVEPFVANQFGDLPHLAGGPRKGHSTDELDGALDPLEPDGSIPYRADRGLDAAPIYTPATFQPAACTHP